jgi:hypothetical protein
MLLSKLTFASDSICKRLEDFNFDINYKLRTPVNRLLVHPNAQYNSPIMTCCMHSKSPLPSPLELSQTIKEPKAAATTPVIATTVHLTPPLASTPALFVADGLAPLEVADEVELELSVPWTRPWTVLGMTLVADLALA